MSGRKGLTVTPDAPPGLYLDPTRGPRVIIIKDEESLLRLPDKAPEEPESDTDASDHDVADTGSESGMSTGAPNTPTSPLAPRFGEQAGTKEDTAGASGYSSVAQHGIYSTLNVQPYNEINELERLRYLLSLGYVQTGEHLFDNIEIDIVMLQIDTGSQYTWGYAEEYHQIVCDEEPVSAGNPELTERVAVSIKRWNRYTKASLCRRAPVEESSPFTLRSGEVVQISDSEHQILHYGDKTSQNPPSNYVDGK
ncbi:hypothetical protein C8Q80DRAFT_1116777 [Daedaleopsis nitida]|nr:hypothetical protein C8Q80DRAFT_1116777 [Daedaleopsis nitida]